MATKTFARTSISREQYRAVRQLVSESSRSEIVKLDIDKLFELRYDLQVKRLEVTNENRPNGDTVCKTVTMQYIPAAEQPQKLWAYREAIRQTLKLISDEITKRTNVVSPMLTALTAQEGAEPVQPAPAEAASELEESIAA